VQRTVIFTRSNHLIQPGYQITAYIYINTIIKKGIFSERSLRLDSGKTIQSDLPEQTMNVSEDLRTCPYHKTIFQNFNAFQPLSTQNKATFFCRYKKGYYLCTPIFIQAIKTLRKQLIR
jgi:hypothetical protein